MKKHNLIILYFLLITGFAYSQSGWITLNSGLTSDLKSVIILDSNYYITAGEGNLILVSTNAGLSWENIQSPVSGLTDIDFVTSEIGFIITDYDLLKTTNKGINWSVLPRNMYSSFQMGIDFIDESTGFISGSDDSPTAYVIKTSNGGLNWNRHWMNDLGGSSYIKFFDLNNGISLVCNRLHYTTNGGVNWSNNFYPFACFTSIFSINQNNIFGCSYQGKIFHTTNLGLNWEQQLTGTTRNVNNLYFLDENYGFAVGDSGLILRTSDAGMNWSEQFSNTNNNLKSIYFFNRDIGIIAGENGTILKTTTGGITFINSTSSVNAENFYLAQNYPNPFNPSTQLEFGILKLGFVSLKVYNSLGKEVATLVNESKPAGSYSVEFDGSSLSSGVYYYILEAGDFAETKRMVLLK